jgi:transketolase
MTVLAPCDAEEMERAMLATEHHEGPIYVRIAKGGEPVVSKPELGFAIGRAIPYREPGDALFVTTGVMLQRAIEACAILEKSGIRAGIVHCHTVKPFDMDTLLGAAAKARAVISIEEHTILGGLGSAVAEALAEGLDKPPRFKRLGLPDTFPDEYGSQDTLLGRYGLSAADIAAQAQRLLALRLAPCTAP